VLEILFPSKKAKMGIFSLKFVFLRTFLTKATFFDRLKFRGTIVCVLATMPFSVETATYCCVAS